MDLLESGDEREPRPLGPRLRAWLAVRPAPWVVAVVGALALSTLAAGVVAGEQVRQEQAREAARVEVDLRVVGSTSSTVRGVARGQLDLLLVNRRENRVRLGELRLLVEGLQVTRVEPAFGRPLGAYDERAFRVSFVVPDCSRLVLPGTLSVTLLGDGQSLQREQLAVVDPRDPQRPSGAVGLGACPPGSGASEQGGESEVAARPAGGGARRVGPGAEGSAALEVRNVGAPVRLLSVDARVPGVRFTPLVLDGGRTLATDGLVVVRLRFTIEDCALLRRSGSLLLRIERFGGVQELGLRVTAEPAGGLGPQVRLPVVLDACD